MYFIDRYKYIHIDPGSILTMSPYAYRTDDSVKHAYKLLNGGARSNLYLGDALNTVENSFRCDFFWSDPLFWRNVSTAWIGNNVVFILTGNDVFIKTPDVFAMPIHGVITFSNLRAVVEKDLKEILQYKSIKLISLYRGLCLIEKYNKGVYEELWLMWDSGIL